ncbi:MAG TPA: hypothetical protein VFA22_08240 [Stellaceae bacterium]|nr:hypothetical protein [Stellaceae bacterium]
MTIEHPTLLANPAWPRHLARWLGPDAPPDPGAPLPDDGPSEAQRKPVRDAAAETPRWPRVFPGL